MANLRPFLGIPGLLQLLLLLLLRDLRVKAQDTKVQQSLESVQVLIGEDLHLECLVSEQLQPGPVKWYLGEGPQRKLIYAGKQTPGNNQKIKRKSPSSRTDFTIFIHNVTLEDAGTYYCVKEKKSAGNSKDWLKGRGTVVVVKGSRRQSTLGLWMGLFLNKVAMCLFLLGLFQMKKHKGSLARYFARSSQEVKQAESSI